MRSRESYGVSSSGNKVGGPLGVGVRLGLECFHYWIMLGIYSEGGVVELLIHGLQKIIALL